VATKSNAEDAEIGSNDKMKTIEIEEAVARMFGIRQNLIVPNISWGLGLHECDLLIVRKSGCAVEVEIKISLADLKKDARKRHNHIDRHNRIGHLYFAVPEKLLGVAERYAPASAGIIVVAPTNQFNGYEDDDWVQGEALYISKLRAYIHRPAIKRKNSGKLTEAEINYVARLGCMRIWNLKAKLIKAMSDTDGTKK
jgi:hypothetical protein